MNEGWYTMTVGDLKRLLEGADENKVVVFRDSMNGWCNLQNCVDTYPDYIVLLEDSNVLFDD